MADAEQLIETASLDPDTLKMVRDAFNGVWAAISANYGAASATGANGPQRRRRMAVTR